MMPVNKNFENLSNKKFGRFIVTTFSRITNYKTYWFCKCLCGNETEIRADLLKIGKTKLRCKYSCPFGEQKTKKGESGFSRLLYIYKKQAKTRSHEWFLTEQDFRSITSKKCFFCNSEPSFISTHCLSAGASEDAKNWSKYVYNGIDRIDNNIGYIKDNCIPCCGHCNYAKQDLSVKDFLNHIEKIYKHQRRANG